MAIKIIPSDGTVNGKTLKEFAKIYWQALCQTPKSQNPAWQNTGSKDDSFNKSVNADLYMLSSSVDPQTAVTRDIEVPSGKGLFIPVVPVEVSEFETSSPLVGEANKDQAGIVPSSLSLELDGSSIDINELNRYNINPNDIGQFTVNFPPQDAIFNTNNRSGPCNAVAAGRYVWTEPLSPGKHTVKHRGKLDVEGPAVENDFSEDITYNINVR
ncbi:MAG TPA: hypothetical protein VJ767_05920 [Nitrososphaeraceae archaeon]|jgi:hypothetical protein|nr:hypothetical protein [Nitrososphaeraceae archaeon]